MAEALTEEQKAVGAAKDPATGNIKRRKLKAPAASTRFLKVSLKAQAGLERALKGL